MNLGDTYVNVPRGSVLSHLWLTISEPTGANRIAIVNVSSQDDGLDDLPIIGPSDHPWLTRESFLRTPQARLASIAHLREAFSKKLLLMKERMTKATLTKVQEAVYQSKHTRRDVKMTLEDQGLV